MSNKREKNIFLKVAQEYFLEKFPIYGVRSIESFDSKGADISKLRTYGAIAYVYTSTSSNEVLWNTWSQPASHADTSMFMHSRQ